MVKYLQRTILLLAMQLPAYFGFSQFSIGDKVADFQLTDQNGQIVSLQSLSGKYVLIDFWASWCGPCRSANKDLVKHLAEYQKRGLEILSISLDENKQSWLKAIKADKMSWLQVNDPGGWDSKMARIWNIDAIPTTYLIDDLGKVVFYNPSHKQIMEALRREKKDLN